MKAVVCQNAELGEQVLVQESLMLPVPNACPGRSLR